MPDSANSSASDGNVNKSRQGNSEHPQKSVVQERDDLIRELDACKSDLLRKERTILVLKKELESLRELNPLREEEVSLERITAEMEKAQEMATMGSWVLEVDTGHVTWTPELHRMFGQDPSSPVPTMEEQEHWYTKKSYADMVEAISRTIEEGSPYNLELEIIRRDGTTRILRSIGEAESDETGRIVWLRGVAQDITELKETETKLKQALEQEKTARIYKDQFLANMSHEIRTPINGIVGFASLLREELNDRTRNDYIDTIETCSNQLLNLIDDIIDVAKIEAGEITIENKSFNLGKLTRETAATIEAVMSEKGINHLELITHIPESSEGMEIDSDPLRIQQILINLLNNALKFSHKGTIEFGFELSNETTEFYVKDEGIGIEPNRKELIFERFEHLEGTTTKYEGTGLGLSISKGLAELLGATISVESELGVGSTFRLTLPQQAKKGSQDTEFQPVQKQENKTQRAGTVLVAEDELLNQKLIKRVLQSAPYEVLYANDGKQAVQIYREHPQIQAVLMDIRMPIMNGDVAAQEILKFDADAKIIAQTAYAMNKDIKGFIKQGFVDFIAKPYKSQELLDVLKKWA